MFNKSLSEILMWCIEVTRQNSIAAIIGGIVGGSIGCVLWYRSPIIYTSELHFILKESPSGGMNALSSIMGSFGLGTGSVGAYNLDKLVGLCKSSELIKATLMSKAKVKSQNQFETVGHWLYSLNQEEVNHSKNKYSLLEIRDQSKYDSLAMISLVAMLASEDGPLSKAINCDYDTRSEIVTITTKSLHPALSTLTARRVFEELEDLYIKQSIEGQEKGVSNLRRKLDSLKIELDFANRKIARLEDTRQGIQLRRDRIELDQSYTNRNIILGVYAEIMKNYELSNMMLQNTLPMFRVITEPNTIYDGTKSVRLRMVAAMATIGVIIAIGLMLFKDYLAK